MATAAAPPQFAKFQLDAYLEYIGLPELINLPDDAPRDLELLTRVHIHQISAVPYENLKLHYDTVYQVSIDPHVVYTKIMAGRGRGGYCMEVSVLFKYILEALGFNVYWTGVRIRPRNGPTPWGDYIGL
jgi:arylamine N-acetyltransferase